MLATSSDGPLWYLLAGGLASVATLIGLFATQIGRNAMGRMFKGQAIEKITQTSADAIATVESAYNVLRSEHERVTAEYKDTITTCRNENVRLRERVASLETQVSGMADANALAQIVRDNQQELLAAIRRGPG